MEDNPQLLGPRCGRVWKALLNLKIDLNVKTLLGKVQMRNMVTYNKLKNNFGVIR
jgi:hypothetical protein